MGFKIIKLGTANYTEILSDTKLSYHVPANYAVRRKEDRSILADIHFQDGPIKEVGVNGVANEDLINIVVDRLSYFQKSEFACEENAQAIKHLQLALGDLRRRTDGRVKRNVEGRNIV